MLEKLSVNLKKIIQFYLAQSRDILLLECFSKHVFFLNSLVLDVLKQSRLNV